jgi:predicted ATPase
VSSPTRSARRNCSACPALGELIVQAAGRTQVVAVSHSAGLIQAVGRAAAVTETELTAFEPVRDFGQTAVAGRGALDQPAWHWPKR